MMNHYDRFIKDLEKLVSFRSVQDEKNKVDEESPFGIETKKALTYFLEIARNMGFETINYDNYIGEISYGTGENGEIGIIGHLDVVPEGDGWLTPPYILTKIDDTYYGRGLSDDKTPLLMCLYALNELKEKKITPKTRIRLFCGCNEESGWKDVEYLRSKTTIPEYGFSPDGNFPLTYAEKGMYIVTFKIPLLKRFSEISGGTVINAVCEKATCKETGEINIDLVKKHNLQLTDDVLTSIGKSAHGSHPENGVNALNNLFNYFLDCGEKVEKIVEYVLNDKSGIRQLKNPQGSLTLSPDIIEQTTTEILIKCDMRVPAPLGMPDFVPYLDKMGIEYEIQEKHNPVMSEKDGAFAQNLLNAYKFVTGEKDVTPIAMGGSTFARVFKKGYSFGMDGLMGFDGQMHQANERVSEKVLFTAYEIYRIAIENLAK